MIIDSKALWPSPPPSLLQRVFDERHFHFPLKFVMINMKLSLIPSISMHGVPSARSSIPWSPLIPNDQVSSRGAIRVSPGKGWQSCTGCAPSVQCYTHRIRQLFRGVFSVAVWGHFTGCIWGLRRWGVGVGVGVGVKEDMSRSGSL